MTATLERDGERREVVVRWVVGCDGMHSAVREAAGIDVPRHRHRRAVGRVRRDARRVERRPRRRVRPSRPAAGDPHAVARATVAGLPPAELGDERPRRRGGRGAPASRAGRRLHRGREPHPVPLSLAGRRPLSIRPRAARGRRRPCLHAGGGPRDEHGSPGRLQPRLEARPGLPRRGGRGPARHLRGRAQAGRRAGRVVGRRRRDRARDDRPGRAGRTRRRAAPDARRPGPGPPRGGGRLRARPLLPEIARGGRRRQRGSWRRASCSRTRRSGSTSSPTARATRCSSSAGRRRTRPGWTRSSPSSMPSPGRRTKRWQRSSASST